MQVYPSDSYEARTLTHDWWKKAQGSGIYSTKETMYLPAVLVDINSYKTIRGIELGSRGKTVEASVQFDILAANSEECDKIADLIYMMETKAFNLMNINQTGFIWPLNVSGVLSNNAQTWPYMSNNFSMGIARFMENANVRKMSKSLLPVLHSRVIMGLEVDVNP